MSFSLETWASPKIAQLQQMLLSSFETEESILHQACKYPLQTGGKRIRPLFLLATMEALGEELSQDAYICATALELIHTYSLVHDDLPCMDDDDFRRGKPTVHKIYGDGNAVLVGDAILTKAFEILSQCTPTHLPALLACIGKAAGTVGMIGGQALDVGLEGKITDLEQLKQLHSRKTGALICAAIDLATILCSVSEEKQATLHQFGQKIGLAFQLADDILDAEEDAKADGPPSFVKFLGINATAQQAEHLLEESLTLLNSLENPEALRRLALFTVKRDH
jgi:geranylgeranyl pyrophosphate synthase